MNDDNASTPQDGRFETLFEQAPFSIQLFARDGRTLRVNQAWKRLWQVREGDGLLDFMLTQHNVLTDPDIEAKGLAEYFRRAFAGESVQLPDTFFDHVELGAPARVRWVRASASPILGQDGEVREVMLVHEDITTHKQAELERRTDELRLQQLANMIPQLAWMADPTGAIHWYNDRWYEYTGTVPKDMVGWGWQSVHDLEVLPDVLQRWTFAIENGEPFQMTFPLKGRDGRFRPFFTQIVPLKDSTGAVQQWFGTNTDVSQIEEAERGLREAEERLRLATTAGNIGTWELDVDSDRLTWSEQVYSLHGLDVGTFGGRTEDFMALVHPEDRERVQAQVQRTMQTRQTLSAEFRALLPGGGERWLAASGHHHVNSEGSVRLVGATVSIDAYKRAEAKLRETDRRKDEFLAMLAHELRNPLAPIATAAHLLRRPDLDEQKVRSASAIISRQVKHITELMEDLLDVSRVTRGLVELDKTPVDLKAVLSSAAEQARPLIEARRHVLTSRLNSEDAFVLGDSTRLIQAVTNVLNNAAKYTPPGGEIALNLEVLASRATITVKDNGTGIEAALLPQVFELFTQGSRAPDRAQGGLGIGLALVRSIVELHGGEVVASSAGAGAGSTFTMTFALLEESSGVRAFDDAPALDQDAMRPLNIMVVDDNRDAAEVLEMVLAMAGHQVAVQHDARSALDALRGFSPDVFILDIGLPDVDGHTLARRLKEAGQGGLLIALTGYGQAQDRELSKAAGFDHHLVKPVDHQVLAGVLEKVSPTATRDWANRRTPVDDRAGGLR